MKDLIKHTIAYLGIRIIMLIGIIAVLLLAYFFYNASIDMLGYHIENPLYQYTENLNWWLHLIIYFTILSFLSAFTFMILGFYYIKKRDDNKETEQKYKMLFTERLVDYIYSDSIQDQKINNDNTNEVKDILDLKNTLNNRLAQEVFFSLMIRLQLLTSADLAVQFSLIIKNLGLMESFEYFLYSYNKSERIIAMKIISYLKPNEDDKSFINYLNNLDTEEQKNRINKLDKYEDTITKYMNSNDFTLRNDATIALIRLSRAKNLDLLLSQRKHISRLGINAIVNTVEKLKSEDINFHDLIESQNPRVAVIGLLLAKSYNKIEYKNLIKQSLSRNFVLFHEVAWEVYTYFSSTEEDLNFMMASFKDETDTNKLSILNTIKNFDYNDDIGNFLDYVIKNEEIVMKIIAMKYFFEVNVGMLFSYKKSSDKKISDAYKEVTDLIII